MKKPGKLAAVFSLVFAVSLATVSLVPTVSHSAGSATLYLYPSSGTHTVGSTFTVEVRVNTGGENVNAVQADFTYPTSRLQFQSISSSGSAFGINASSSGGSGSVSIARGNIADVNGSAKLVAKVTFKTLNNTGTATINFSGSSAVVRSSDSTDVLGTTSGGSYTIKAASTPSGGGSSGSGSTPKTSNTPDTSTTTNTGTTSDDKDDTKTTTDEKPDSTETTDPVVTDSEQHSDTAKETEIKTDGGKNQTLMLAGAALAGAAAALLGFGAVAVLFLRKRRGLRFTAETNQSGFPENTIAPNVPAQPAITPPSNPAPNAPAQPPATPANPSQAVPPDPPAVPGNEPPAQPREKPHVGPPSQQQ